jgi:hypothetical protein
MKSLLDMLWEFGVGLHGEKIWLCTYHGKICHHEVPEISVNIFFTNLFHRLAIQAHMRVSMMPQLWFYIKIQETARPFGQKFNTHTFCNQLTDSTEQSPSWEVNSHSAAQEILRLSWNTKVHYRDHKRLPLVPVLSLINLVHTLLLCISEIHSNII